MESPPKQVLFEKHFRLKGGSEGPLFENQKDLARAIVDLRIGYDKILTLNSFLSQIFKIPGKYERPKSVPPKLLHAIIQAACKVVGDRNEEMHVTWRIKHAFELWKSQLFSFYTSENMWSYYLGKFSEIPCVATLVLPNTDLFKWETNTRSLEFMDNINVLFERYKNWNEDVEQSMTEWLEMHLPRSENYWEFPYFNRMVIYLPDLSMIVEFWKLIVKYLTEVRQTTQNEIATLLNHASTLIFTYTINPHHCTIPMVYLKSVDYSQSREEADVVEQLFSFSISEHFEGGIVTYSKEIMKSWINQNMLPFNVMPEKFGIQEIPYDSIKNMI